MNSRLYSGTLGHYRHLPVNNGFRYQVFMLYLDLDELSSVFHGHWLWSTSRANFAWFRRADYMGCAEQSLSQSVRDLVAEKTGSRPAGPIRLLTNLRYLFYKSNPVSFYYCFEQDGETLHSVVAEVTNTPWGQCYCYVLAEKHNGQQRKSSGEVVTEHHFYQTAKRFTVSPFMPLDMDYQFEFSLPGEQLLVKMENHRQGEKVFDVELLLESQAINSSNLAKHLLKIPLMTAKVTAAIYWQAAKIWFKGVPFLGHAGEKHQ
ncbi:MAG: DUF1365 domain-containing protein [Porticoccaceae bacterium]